MDDPLKILIVDDEPESRDLLGFMLQEEKDLVIVGYAGNVEDGLKQLQKQSPDLVFLDIQMPEKDGFDFIELMSERGLEAGIVFVTAFENFAIQAIRNSVFDYILKPVRKQEILAAVDRYRSRKGDRQSRELQQLIGELRGSGAGKLKLNTRSGYVLVHPREVVFCQADGNYTHIQLSGGAREVTTQNLGQIEDLLGEDSFFRASRSYLVNLHYLVRVDRKSSLCILEYPGQSVSIKIPAQKIRILESIFG